MIVDFTPANDLEQTLVRAATDPVARPEFYRCLLVAELYILTEEGHLENGQTSKFAAAADPALIT